VNNQTLRSDRQPLSMSIDAPPPSVAVSSRGTRGYPLTLLGEIDIANAGAIAQRLEKICRRRPGRIVVDLADVEFMDCAGISPLLQAAARVTVEVKRPSGAVRRLIDAAGAAQILHVEDGATDRKIDTERRDGGA
jgi:anti-sigma B factor antagonist